LLGAVLVIAYWLAVPLVNDRLGTDLPELRNWNGAKRAAPVADRPADRQDPAALDRTRAAESAAEPTESEEGALRYGLLREVGPERYLSPAGLLYGPGSQEGHRLQHIERHTRDLPTRPGPHGVFAAEMPEVLRWIDEAYAMTRTETDAVRTERQGERVVHTVDLGRRLGYVGGRQGNREGKPEARRLRIVLESNRVITAFPL
jgi:hypothetical protein